MAIIYSYPLDNNPKTADLLLGSSSANGKPTKSFSIASLVSLVTVPVTPGVTSVSASNAANAFIDVSTGGAPITGAGTISASLTATGNPSTTTFLRGDNKWMPASSIGSPDVQIINQAGTILTNAVTSIDFSGAGVTTTLLSGNSTTGTVQVEVEGAVALVDSVAGGIGITASPSTGNVVLNNTGVVSVTAGTNITISSTGGGNTGNVTVNSNNNPGTVQSITAGQGLQSTGTLTTTPTISLQYSGSNNYISVAQSDATITLNDIIAYDQASSGNVKTTALSDIPTGSLPLVESYITAGDSNTVKNNTDSFPTTAKINNVVTLTAAEYAAPFVPLANTLYIVTPGGTTKDVILTQVIAPAAWGTLNTDYKITGDTAVPITRSGILGADYSFSVTVEALGDKYFSVPVTGNTIVNTFPAAASTNVQINLAGTLSNIYIPPIRATLLVVANIQTIGGGPTATLGGSLTGSFVETTTASSLTIATTDFVTTATAPTGYSWVGGAPTIVNFAQSGAVTITGSQTVVTTVTGVLQLT